MAGQTAPRLAKRIVVVRNGLPVDALAAREDLSKLGIVAHAGGLTESCAAALSTTLRRLRRTRRTSQNQRTRKAVVLTAAISQATHDDIGFNSFFCRFYRWNQA